MTPLAKTQKESVMRRISFIQAEMEDLKEYLQFDYGTYAADRMKRRNVERIIENVSNALIDIGKIILAGERVEVPGTYREVFTKLSETGFITDQLAKQLGKLSRSRNILAHQYLDLKWETVSGFLSEAPEAVRNYMQIVNDHLKK